MLVSAVQQSESAVCKHTFPPSWSEMLFKRRCWDKTHDFGLSSLGFDFILLIKLAYYVLHGCWQPTQVSGIRDRGMKYSLQPSSRRLSTFAQLLHGPQVSWEEYSRHRWTQHKWQPSLHLYGMRFPFPHCPSPTSLSNNQENKHRSSFNLLFPSFGKWD